MNAKVVLTIQIRYAWWFRPYINTLGFMLAITGLSPDPSRLERVISRAMRAHVVSKKTIPG